MNENSATEQPADAIPDTSPEAEEPQSSKPGLSDGYETVVLEVPEWRSSFKVRSFTPEPSRD